MSGPVRVLDEAVINRIAAGEVIERPVSVVKELVENSIDAGAGNIQIDVESGGKKLIRVADNGSGMSHDDAFLALERHATSKLRTEADLVGIATLGFRGEALASIAAVSRLSLLTSDNADDAGTDILIEGGVLRKSGRIGMGRGTIIEVRNLFFNVPVRRKFLKGTQLEAAHVHEFVVKMALAFPGVAFSYKQDGKPKIEAPVANDILERIRMLYSKDIRDSLMEVNHSKEAVRVRGYVARPPYARSDMRAVQTFVNGRSVRDKLFNSAVNRAFSNLMERGRYPLAILFLELPPEEVDVYVHPQKAEVRFIAPQIVYNVILDGVYSALTGAPFHSLVTRVPTPIFPRPRIADVHDTDMPDLPRREAAYSSHDITQARPDSDPSISTPQWDQYELRHSRQPRFSSMSIVGALPGSFLLLHSDNSLVVKDHHAAHERVLFEQLKRCGNDDRGVETQDLLIPHVLELPRIEARILASQLHVVKQVGFRIEEFGENDFVIKGTPAWLGTVDIENFFRDLVTVMMEIGTTGDPERLHEQLFKRMACKSAVKETSALRPEEIQHLLSELDSTGPIETCPHGRPLVVEFPFDEIRRKMGRK